MRDLKYRVYFENLLREVKNELVDKALDEGKLALGYSCYYIPEVLMNLDGCFSVRLRAPGIADTAIATYYMSEKTCMYSRSILELSFSSGLNKECAEIGREMLEICEKCVKEKINVRPKTRHRTLVCGAPSSYYMHFSTWMYECWGVNTVAVLNNMSHHEFISEDDKEEALWGVAQLWEQAIMRRHLVGGYENLLEMFEEYERFNCDMIVFYDDITCKGSKSMTGMIQDIANERNIPLVWISHDLIDPVKLNKTT